MKMDDAEPINAFQTGLELNELPFPPDPDADAFGPRAHVFWRTAEGE